MQVGFQTVMRRILPVLLLLMLPPEVSDSQSSSHKPTAKLAGTTWRLVRFLGKDGKNLTPSGKAKYTIAFGKDGQVNARIDCNRGHGTWKSPGPNQLQLGPLALTRAMCPPSPLNDRIAKDWEAVRLYTIKDGRLFLSLTGDAGIYEFEPAAPS